MRKNTIERRNKNKEYQKKHYKKNKQYYVDKSREQRLKIQNFLQTIKSVPCMDCGKEYPYYVMDLDHRNGTEKLYNPSLMTNCGSMKKVKEEVSKCDVVCSNCHRSRTYKRKNGEIV